MAKRNTTQSKVNRRSAQASQSSLVTFDKAPNELNEYYRSLLTDGKGFYKFLEEEGY